MRYLKLNDDGTVGQYPYAFGQLRRDNPGTSFPKVPTDEMLASWGVHPVTEIPQPPIPHTHRAEQGAPQLVEGAWVVAWNAVALTADEWADKQAQQWEAIRNERTEKLLACDWTQLPDAPVDAAAWATYRQALRDITDQADPFEIVWPVQP